MNEPSTRSQVIARRTYQRPLDEAGVSFESWAQTIDRVIGHQRWLWQRAQGSVLSPAQETELDQLRRLLLSRKAVLAGRTYWLGGTNTAKAREASQFNCAFSRVATVHDVVDHFWLLLQGCGVGGLGMPGILNGFAKPVQDITVVRSAMTLDDWQADVRGHDRNRETTSTENGVRTWRLTIGDSAAAWAKALGKILAMKQPVDEIILDFSNVRAAGVRLRGYGWISSGDETISRAFHAICEIMSRRAGQLLTRMDLLDVSNWMGTTLSSRRSAEIMLCPYGDSEWETFAYAKKDHWSSGNPQRAQSNNSLLFEHRPSKAELLGLFTIMQMTGGSEPGFINAAEARRRAPWFAGVNPCAEILLGDKSFCNLVEINTAAFNGDFYGLIAAVGLIARANYRQTCVDLRDGVLQHSWHELNQFLRLCGVGLTGLVGWSELSAKTLQWLRARAVDAANSMADELGLPRPKAVTTVKPSGTMSKVMDTTEGCHRPLGRFIFNNVGFSAHDPLVDRLRAAGYRVFENPYDNTGVLVTFPVEYPDVAFDTVTVDDKQIEVNLESVVDQLGRYKLLMDNYVQHNCSITVSYSPDEIPAIVDWVHRNWDSFVGVSFILRNDPTKTAADLGYPYLPQEVVTEDEFREYQAKLQPVDLDTGGIHEIDQVECVTGSCPVR